MGATRSGSPREVNPAGDRRAALPGTVARMPAETYPWDRPLGARVVGDGLVELRVWAPGDERRVTVRIARAEHELADEGFGVRSAVVPARPGDDYWLTLDGKRLPDPASRWQPRGLRGASRVVDHRASRGPTTASSRPPLRDAVLYELHVGTFTRRGHVRRRRSRTCRSSRELGVTAHRADAGRRVPRRATAGATTASTSRAAHSAYGGPEGLQRLVDAAHARRPRRDPRRRLQPRRRQRQRRRSRRSAPTSPTSTRRSGAARSTTTTPAATRCASGCCRAPRAGSATSTSTACASTRSTRSSTPAPTHVLAEIAERVHDRPAACVIAESRPQRPAR